MFYIQSERRQRLKDIAKLHIGPAVVVFIAFFIITVWSTINAVHASQTSEQQALTEKTNSAQLAIQNRIAIYENILRASSAFIESSQNVSVEEWQSFISGQQLSTRFPGARAIGLLTIVPSSQLSAFQTHMRANGQPDYQVFPVGDRETYAPVTYVSALNDDTKRALGFDMYSDSVRTQAMALARDSDDIGMTGVLPLLNTEPHATTQQGFVMFMPIYTAESLPLTINQRRAQLSGYVYVLYRGSELIDKVLGSLPQTVGYEIYGGKLTSDNLLFRSASYANLHKNPNSLSQIQTFKVNNQLWIIHTLLDSKTVNTEDKTKPSSVFWSGMLFSFLIAAFIYLLLLNRSHAFGRKEENYVQEAKDELLALASHQLRTPATGVKQYIGMLREGYAGELNDKQRIFLDKANESNERQLTTINEMLSVAKADAGKIDPDIQNFDIVVLLREIVEEQLLGIRERHQKLTIHVPQKTLIVAGDRVYLRMAIENIVNNSIKYTPTKGTITLTLKTKRNGALDIIVKDTGVGVDKKDYKLLFKKFSRIPSRLSNQVTGTGIGLYLSLKIVQAHRGTISFKSKEGEGSVCTIHMPKHTVIL